MEIVNFMKDEALYKKNPDNDFQKHSTYGLTLEGIKKYYLTPENHLYHHQEKLKAEIKKRIELHEQMKQNKFRLSQTINANNNNNTSENIESFTKTIINPTTRSKTIENIKKNHPFNFTVHNTESIDINDDNKNNRERNYLSLINKKGKGMPLYIRKKVNNLKLNLYNDEMKKKTNNIIGESCKIIGRDRFLPKLNPRPVIIDYNLTYSRDNGKSMSTKYTNGYKNLGHNGPFMGIRYNPDNYEIRRKNRTKRNVFGTLFPH